MSRKFNAGLFIILILGILFVGIDLWSNSRSQNNIPTIINEVKELSEKRDIVLVSGESKVNLQVEIARTAEDKERGLMFRTMLVREKGMLFVFDDESMRSFWMKNTLIPLDIIYFDGEGHFVSVSRDAQPCKVPDNECPTYPSAGVAKYVLETNANLINESMINSSLRIEGIAGI